MVRIIFLVLVLSIFGCKQVQEEYTIIFDSPKNNEIITNENQKISILLLGSKEGNVKVFINQSLLFTSTVKERITFDTTITENTNVLECVIEKNGQEVKREKIYFTLKKQIQPKSKKTLEVKPVYAKIKKYEEIKPQVIIPKIEEIKESKYISSINLEILNENETGYFKDEIKASYRIEFFDEFKSKALEYLKKVSIEITDPQDNKLLSETLKEPGLTLNLNTKQLPTGVYILTVRAEDIKGEIYETSKWIKIDKTPPSVVIENLTNDMIVRGTLQFNLQVEDESGIKEFYFSVEEEKINYRQKQKTITFLLDSTKFGNGKKQITIYVADKLQNEFKTNISIYIDNWHEEIVDPTPGAGFNISSFVDKEKRIYLAYYNINKRNLYFAKLNQNKWEIELVDKEIDSGKYPSIFVDKFNRIHISYTFINPKWDDEDLRYALKEDENWKITTLDQQDKAGRYTSIVVDDRGIPHISYYNYSIGSLRYITYNLNMKRWEISVPDSYENVGSDTCIGIHNNVIHISYLDNANGDLKYCYKGINETDAGWKFEVVDSDGKVGYYNTMKIDSYGNIHIVYYDSTQKALKYAVKTGNKWTKTIVDKKDDPGRFTSMFIDDDNNVHVSYYVESKKELRYALFNGKKWEIQTVISDRAGGYSSIVVVNQKPIIFFYDLSSNNLKLAKK